MRVRKTALITGASAGIGLELARLFARHRNDVVLVARRGERLQEIAAECEAETGVTAHVVVADLASAAGPRQVYDEVMQRGIEIEYLVNNAGFGTFGPFADTDPEQTMNLVRLNIGALTELTTLFLPDMVERHSGRVLNVASAAAFQPGPLMATYYASKAYALHFSEALNEELEGKGVSVTALCPGGRHGDFGVGAEQAPDQRRGSGASGLRGDDARQGDGRSRVRLQVPRFHHPLRAATLRRQVRPPTTSRPRPLSGREDVR